MAFVTYCPKRDLDRNAYRVELVGHRLVWVTSEGGKQVRNDSEPHTDLCKRIKAQVLSWLPIENLLSAFCQNRHVNLMRQLLASIFTLLQEFSLRQTLSDEIGGRPHSAHRRVVEGDLAEVRRDKR